jgi:asparagine N-glycosylation enzyme membrane subunit Stt3
LRAIWVAGVGGLVVGHILWLAGISAAISSTDVPTWVLVVAAASLFSGALAVLLGRRAWRRKDRKSEIWAAFLLAFPISPVLLSLIVLGVTYL